METMTVTFSFTLSGEPVANTRNYCVGRVGRGNVLHLMRQDEKTAICGSGNFSVMHRLHSRRGGYLTGNKLSEVTCKKCLEEIGRLAAEKRNTVTVQ